MTRVWTPFGRYDSVGVGVGVGFELLVLVYFRALVREGAGALSLRGLNSKGRKVGSKDKVDVDVKMEHESAEN